jgi:hypothetical protein
MGGTCSTGVGYPGVFLSRNAVPEILRRPQPGTTFRNLFFSENGVTNPRLRPNFGSLMSSGTIFFSKNITGDIKNVCSIVAGKPE